MEKHATRSLTTLVLLAFFFPVLACAPKAEAEAGSSGPPLPAPAVWRALKPDLSAEDARVLVSGIKAATGGDFLERAWALVLARDPEAAFSYGVSRLYDIPEDELSDLSDAHALGTRELYLALRAELERRLGSPGGEDTLALAAFSRWLSDRERVIWFSFDQYPVSPSVNSADQLALDYFTEYREIRDVGDAERWIACLAALPRKMEGLAAALDLRASLGVVLPRGIYEYTLGGLRSIAESSPEGSPFYEAFSRKLGKAVASGAIARAEGDRLLVAASEAIRVSALPAWRLVAEALERQSGRVPAQGGASRLPEGRAYYAACLSRYTTTSLDAAAIRDLGLRELSRIQAEMRSRFTALGYAGKDESLSSLYGRLGAKEGILSGAVLLARIKADIARMDGRLGEIVAKRPGIPVEAVSGELGGYYQAPSGREGRPGRYFVAATDRRYAWDIETTVWHETLPGHHLQIARAIEADLPGFLRMADFPAFTEGWALYAERLASEMGVYADNPAGELGRLRMEALRAARLVADTGLNASGWSYDKARAFIVENTGLDDGMAMSEATRYLVDPGQATAYFVGYAELLRLREEGRAALGKDFDLRAFHEAVLGHGALPLETLGELVRPASAKGGN